MKKLLLQFLLLALPCIVYAQTPPPLFKDFDKSVTDITTSFKLNDHVSVFQMNLDNEKFDLIAVDDNMKVVWKSTFKGFSLGAGKFKNKILLVAATDHSYFKGAGNTYQGFIIDPATGKSLLDKIIYTSTSGHMEYPRLLFIEDGSFFTLTVRESDVERKMHVPLPGAFAKVDNEEARTNNITVTNFNEQLESEFTFKPTVPKGLFADINANNHGDIFITGYDKDSGILSTVKYNAGSKEPLTILEQTINAKDNGQLKKPYNVIYTFASVSSPNVLYLGAVYKTPEKEDQLGIIKFDFASKTQKFISEVFTKDHIKAMEKGYERVNKDIDKPNIGPSKNLDLRYIDESDGKLIVTVSGRHVDAGINTAWSVEDALLINAYDLDLNPKFQQILPAQNSYIGRFLPVGYHFEKSHLRIMATYQTGAISLKGLYSELDLETGKWIKQELLSKKKLDNGDYTEGGTTMWNSANYIVPYMSKASMFSQKYDVILQQNNY
jgi:hypothetical protein